MKNKKALFVLPFIASCSAGSNLSTTTMAPLTTVGEINTVVITEPSLSKSSFSFIDDVYFYYGKSLLMSEEETINIGNLWCELMVEGMTSDDVISRINEGSANQDEADYHFAIITSAVINICPSQKEKWSM
jgi:hypothetical protein